MRRRRVRLIDAEGEQVGIVPLSTARARAEAAGMDLVLIADQSTPVVCKIMDYGKHIFEAKKQQRAAQEGAAYAAERNEVSSRDGPGRLPGKTTQPGAFP
jgi:translation initiation factor IF-3